MRDNFLYIIIALLMVVALGEMLYIVRLRYSIFHIIDDFEKIMNMDTNTRITISMHDAYIRKLAVKLNEQLKALRKERLKLQLGDKEIRDAVTNIAHDLRTPLTAICGYMEMLEEEEKTEVVAKYLAIISERIDAMRSLTEELFKYSVVLATDTELKLEMINVNSVLEESILEFVGAFESKKLKPIIELPKQPVMRKVDKVALSRVFSNLISNALKYSESDVRIRLDSDGRIVMANMTSKLQGTDVARIFDRFYTVESARSSTGLGLSIAKKLVESMGGRIYAKYQSGELEIFVELR